MKQVVKPSMIMIALFVAGFVGLFSETALNIALGDLTKIFGVSETTVQWLATGYFLTLGILVPISGILMQKLTTRTLFFISLIASIVGTILAAVSPSFGILLTARVIQAVGLAIMLPLTQNVIFTIFPPQKRGGAMGAMGLVILAGPALGPTIAGLILDSLSWHWIFWVTVPFLVFAIIIGAVNIPNLNETRNISIDLLSVVLSTIGFGGIVYAVSVGGELGWSSMTVLGCLIIGVIALVLFAVRQTKMENPLINLAVFKHPIFVLGLMMNMITFLNMLSMLVILPLFMQVALLLAAFASGLVLLPGSVLNCIFAPIIGKAFDRFGPKAIITPGTILVAIGYFCYAQYGTDTAAFILAITHIVMMLGVGMVLASVQTNTLNALPRHLYADGIAVTQTSQQVAGAIGIGVMVSLYAAKQESLLDAGAKLTEAAASGVSFVFYISFVLAVLNVILSLFLKKSA